MLKVCLAALCSQVRLCEEAGQKSGLSHFSEAICSISTISPGFKWRGVRPISSEKRAGCTGIKRQPQYDAPERAINFRLDDDQTLLRVEREAHNTTAVSSGICPV